MRGTGWQLMEVLRQNEIFASYPTRQLNSLAYGILAHTLLLDNLPSFHVVLRCSSHSIFATTLISAMYCPHTVLWRHNLWRHNFRMFMRWSRIRRFVFGLICILIPRGTLQTKTFDHESNQTSRFLSIFGERGTDAPGGNILVFKIWYIQSQSRDHNKESDWLKC